MQPDCSLRHVLASFGLLICAKTPQIDTMRNHLRGEEIADWMRSRSGSISRYVILDDDSDMLPEQQANFVRTDERHGLTDADAERAIAILNGENRPVKQMDQQSISGGGTTCR
jgi:hypothetical protein